MKKLLYLIFLLPGLWACCNKQSLDTEAEVVFNLSYNRKLSAHQEVNVNTKATANYDVRHIVNVYRADASGTIQNPDGPDYSFSWVGDENSYTASLPQGQYRVLVWSDYQPSGGPALWNASDFANISMSGPHTGSDEYVRVYKGDVPLNVSDSGNRALTIPMDSPMGKFMLYSTESPKPDASGMKARITYTQFMPTSFGMMLDKPADSQSGVQFTSAIQDTPEGTLLLAYDYVLTNGTESSIPVKLEILDKSNQVCSSYNFNIPLMRGKLTTVRGEFFSGTSSGSVHVDPEFEGTITVELN